MRDKNNERKKWKGVMMNKLEKEINVKKEKKEKKKKKD